MSLVADLINSPQLTKRWTPLRPHPAQYALWHSRARFRVVPAGRRSGKTELAKRFTVYTALKEYTWPDAWFILAAPTINQAKRIYWRDLKDLIPAQFRDGRPRESDMTIRLINGAEISVMGMDEPARIEGRPVNGIILDEYGNMKRKIWLENIRPALADRQGWAWLIGVPEGRNHYYESAIYAMNDKSGEWAYFHWTSEDILPASEIAALKRELDPLTYDQEIKANFINFQGRAYYAFDRAIHACQPLKYVPKYPLFFDFDFNSAPGVATVCQEQNVHDYRDTENLRLPTDCQFAPDGEFTAVIGEVWIPRGSNTELVSRKLAQDWGHHLGDVFCYGDATGGAKGSAKVKGSDWDLVKAELRSTYGGRLKFRVPSANPKERQRINAVNSRLRSTDNTIRELIDPVKASHLCKDYEGVTVLEGSAGEIDKKAGDELTHISDAHGYEIHERHPIGGKASVLISTV